MQYPVHGGSRADVRGFRKCKSLQVSVSCSGYISGLNITLPDPHLGDRLQWSVTSPLIRPHSADTGLNRCLLFLLVIKHSDLKSFKEGRKCVSSLVCHLIATKANLKSMFKRNFKTISAHLQLIKKRFSQYSTQM